MRDVLYEKFQQAGVRCGPVCQGIVQLWLGDNEALAELGVPAAEVAGLSAYQLHPTLLDGAFQTALAWLAHHTSSSTVLVPFSVGVVERFAVCPASCYSYVKVVEATPGSARFHVALLDEQGHFLVRVKDFRVRALPTSSPPPATDVPKPVPCYRPVWIEQPVPETKRDEPGNGCVVIVRNPRDFGLGDRLARLHRDQSVLQVIQGEQSQSLHPGTFEIECRQPDGFDQLVSVLKPIDTLYFLGGLQDVTEDPFDRTELDTVHQCGVLGLLRVVKALRKRSGSHLHLRLVVVTNDVQAVRAEDRVYPLERWARRHDSDDCPGMSATACQPD